MVVAVERSGLLITPHKAVRFECGTKNNKQQVVMECTYQRFPVSTVRLSVLPRYRESDVSVCVYQGKFLLSLFILPRLIISIQRIYNRSSLAALRDRPSCGEKHSQKTGRHFGRYASSSIIPDS